MGFSPNIVGLGERELILAWPSIVFLTSTLGWLFKKSQISIFNYQIKSNPGIEFVKQI